MSASSPSSSPTPAPVPVSVPVPVPAPLDRAPPASLLLFSAAWTRACAWLWAPPRERRFFGGGAGARPGDDPCRCLLTEARSTSGPSSSEEESDMGDVVVGVAGWLCRGLGQAQLSLGRATWCRARTRRRRVGGAPTGWRNTTVERSGMCLSPPRDQFSHVTTPRQPVGALRRSVAERRFAGWLECEDQGPAAHCAGPWVLAGGRSCASGKHESSVACFSPSTDCLTGPAPSAQRENSE